MKSNCSVSTIGWVKSHFKAFFYSKKTREFKRITHICSIFKAKLNGSLKCCLFLSLYSSSSPKKSSRLCNSHTHQHPLSKSSQKYATYTQPPKKVNGRNRLMCWGTIISIVIAFW
jgi:hypothetical protein